MRTAGGKPRHRSARRESLPMTEAVSPYLNQPCRTLAQALADVKDTPADTPAARELRREMGDGECDCCGKAVNRDALTTVIAYGIETSACDACRGEPIDA